MTRTILAPAPEPSSALRVTLTRQPAEAEVLCHGCFDSPLGPVVALGAGGALWGLGFAAEGTPDAVQAMARQVLRKENCSTMYYRRAA